MTAGCTMAHAPTAYSSVFCPLQRLLASAFSLARRLVAAPTMLPYFLAVVCLLPLLAVGHPTFDSAQRAVPTTMENVKRRQLMVTHMAEAASSKNSSTSAVFEQPSQMSEAFVRRHEVHQQPLGSQVSFVGVSELSPGAVQRAKPPEGKDAEDEDYDENEAQEEGKDAAGSNKKYDEGGEQKEAQEEEPEKEDPDKEEGDYQSDVDQKRESEREEESTKAEAAEKKQTTKTSATTTTTGEVATSAAPVSNLAALLAAHVTFTGGNNGAPQIGTDSSSLCNDLGCKMSLTPHENLVGCQSSVQCSHCGGVAQGLEHPQAYCTKWSPPTVPPLILSNGHFYAEEDVPPQGQVKAAVQWEKPGEPLNTNLCAVDGRQVDGALQQFRLTQNIQPFDIHHPVGLLLSVTQIPQQVSYNPPKTSSRVQRFFKSFMFWKKKPVGTPMQINSDAIQITIKFITPQTHNALGFPHRQAAPGLRRSLSATSLSGENAFHEPFCYKDTYEFNIPAIPLHGSAAQSAVTTTLDAVWFYIARRRDYELTPESFEITVRCLAAGQSGEPCRLKNFAFCGRLICTMMPPVMKQYVDIIDVAMAHPSKGATTASQLPTQLPTQPGVVPPPQAQHPYYSQLVATLLATKPMSQGFPVISSPIGLLTTAATAIVLPLVITIFVS